MSETILFIVEPCPLGYLLAAATADGLHTCVAGQLRRRNWRLHGPLRSSTAPRGRRQQTERLDSQPSGLSPRRAALLDLPLGARPRPPFSARVWQALQAIPYGSTRTYSQVAQAIGQPAARAAVASTFAADPVALVVPCHRVWSARAAG